VEKGDFKEMCKETKTRSSLRENVTRVLKTSQNSFGACLEAIKEGHQRKYPIE